MWVLNEKVVREALPMAQAIEAMKQGFVAPSFGEAMAPLRTNLSLLGKEAYCLVMPSRVIVESRSAALAEAGELCLSIQQGLVDEGHIHAELGELVAKTKSGRTSAEHITLF